MDLGSGDDGHPDEVVSKAFKRSVEATGRGEEEEKERQKQDQSCEQERQRTKEYSKEGNDPLVDSGQSELSHEVQGHMHEDRWDGGRGGFWDKITGGMMKMATSPDARGPTGGLLILNGGPLGVGFKEACHFSEALATRAEPRGGH